MNTLACAFFLGVAAVGEALAQEQVRPTAQFLEVLAPAREQAMSARGALWHRADAGSAVTVNPAFLGHLAGSRASIMGGSRGGGSYGTVGLAQGRGSWGWGAALQSMASPRIESFTNTGAAAPAMRPLDLAGSLAAGLRLGPVGIGLGAKAIRTRVVTAASTWAMDGGALLRLGPGALSLSGTNLGPPLRRGGLPEPLPSELRLGGSLQVGHAWLVAADAYWPRRAPANVGSGVEYAVQAGPRARGFLRLGYDTAALRVGSPWLSGLRAGLGLGLGAWSIDYAWSSVAGGDDHRVGLGVHWR